jgi:transposase InsO family protein
MVIEGAATAQGIEAGTLTLGTDNGSAFTARRFRGLLKDLAPRRKSTRRAMRRPCAWRSRGSSDWKNQVERVACGNYKLVIDDFEGFP